jgi:hypothetical protein
MAKIVPGLRLGGGDAMAVYVHKMRGRPGKEALPNQKPVAPHYVITWGEHDRAVALGAQLITQRDAERILRQRAGGLEYS